MSMTFKSRLRRSLAAIDRVVGLRAWLREPVVPIENPEPAFDLVGEKEFQWAWVIENMGSAPGRVLEIGCVESPLLVVMACLGFDTVGIDLRDAILPYEFPGLTFMKGDFNELSFEPASFDYVIMVSVVEHIGLAGRYGSAEEPDGDLKAMRKAKQLMKPGARLALTIPVGLDTVFASWHRVYGRKRLPLLFEGYRVGKSRFFAKRPFGNWYEVDEESAMVFPATVERYAVGEYLLESIIR